MKIRFDPELDFQDDAIRAVVDLFDGQETCRTNFTVAPVNVPSDDGQSSLAFGSDLGVGNRLRLLDDDILANLRKIQLRNALPVSEKLGDLNFTVEMETGTGKTYVYLRTIFEMHKKYGFTKFIMVVPSVAIKEGVLKTLQITEEHFKGLYDNTQYDYFIYDSQKLGQVRNFATSDYIQIMVINIAAFNKSFKDPTKEGKANIIHRPHDRMTGNKPIEFIQSTNPIVIIDEPQSVDTTDKSSEAIASLNPLCTLRYSATHVKKHNMVYKLDAVDAYERKLVKQIEVAGIDIQDSHNKAYIKLLKVDNKKSTITAQLELDIQQKDGAVKRKKKTVKAGQDLLEVSGGRSVYDGYIIDDIYCEKDNEYISFTSQDEITRLNEVAGGVDEDQYKQLQIRKTIESHLGKELALRPQGIKVLSLFFIDRVANYRQYDDQGNSVKGKYAVMFEDEYAKAIKKPKYDVLFEGLDRETAAEGVHDGYFSIDQKKMGGHSVNMFRDSKGEGSTKADESTYHLIMKDKEKLLSFDSKLKFIFSHSALREGWDNPNVFQICTLNETGSVIKKRQEIGRGLRIAVNQDGERVHGFEVNRLTVMANESYEDFAHKLQKEIEQDEGIRFGVIEKHMFASVVVDAIKPEIEYLGTERSQQVFEHLQEHDYIDSKGKVQDALRKDLAAGEVVLPDDVKDQADQVLRLLKKVSGKLNVRDADKSETISLNKAIYIGEEFRELWNRIKYRTTFRVDFDGQALIKKCADEISKRLVVGKARFVYRTGRLAIERSGVETDEGNESVHLYDATDFEVPDIVSFLQDETHLTRRSIVEILVNSGRLDDFKNNPQKFIEQVTKLIKDQMQLFIVDGIKYQKIGDDAIYAQELFQNEELKGYLNQNMLKSEKSVYEYVVYDSDIEEAFAKSFERADEVKVYAKLPSWFKIETPLGTYNPDWAVVVDVDGQERLYFVVETKGSLFSSDLRAREQAKIDCGREHFKALGDGIGYEVANSYEKFTETFIQ
ncbi:MAG: DEAD/DEAH box helicase family protein [Phycisphaerales bacterium]|nr:DEAD/DEAH box helicase family protein [Phycisphaerales bacterium]